MKYIDITIEYKLKNMHFSIKEKLEPVIHTIETATEAMNLYVYNHALTYLQMENYYGKYE
ncbi:hypothetical protein AN1V17_01110 [Vallitalea sediminicola]